MCDKEYEAENVEIVGDTVPSNLTVRLRPEVPLIHIDTLRPLERQSASNVTALMEGRVTGRNVAKECFVVQWIKGYGARINTNILTDERTLIYLDGERYNQEYFRFDDWSLDTYSGEAFYPHQSYKDENLNVIKIEDVPGVDTDGVNIYKGTVEFRLNFIISVFRWSDFPNPLSSYFRTPTDPMPLASARWQLHSNF